MTIDVLVPVTRDWCAERFMENIDAPVYAICNDDCIDAWSAAGATIITGPEQTWSQRCNRMFRETNAEWSLFVGEDVKFTKGWQDALEPYLSNGSKVIGTNDKFHSRPDNPWGVHNVVNREYINVYGGTWDRIPGVVFHEGYFHYQSEVELIFTSYWRCLYSWAEECIIEHVDFVRDGFITYDDTRLLGQQHRKDDELTFLRRKNQWEKAVKRGKWE